jgi:hypothetical protein
MPNEKIDSASPIDASINRLTAQAKSLLDKVNYLCESLSPVLLDNKSIIATPEPHQQVSGCIIQNQIEAVTEILSDVGNILTNIQERLQV